MISLNAFADRLNELLPRLMHDLRRQERNYFTRGLIGFPQLRALEHLAREGACSMHQLARAMGSRESTATGMVDRLVELGLVRRARSQEDRRVVHVGITPKGRRSLAQIQNHRRAIILRVFGALSAEDRGRYLEIIERVAGGFAGETAPVGRAGRSR